MKPICQRCDCDLPEDENYWAEGYDEGVCSDCYRDIVVTCQLSGEDDVMPSDVSPYILVKAELARTCYRPPGIYRVLRRPFIFGSLLGGGSLTDYYVRFVAPLPKPDHHYEISGHICRKAAKPYHRIWREAYGLRGLKIFDHHQWQLERAHTRRTILANPEMLRDLECDKDRWGDWADLKRVYDLPDTLPTYHEWLALEHNGVRVFFSYRDLWDSWFTLSPLPSMRYCRGNLIFAASSLSTWTGDGQESYYRNHKACSSAAIIAAIDAGILTQVGVQEAAR